MDGRAHVSLRSYAHTDTTHAHDWHQLVLPVQGAHTVALANVSGTVESGRGVLVVSGLGEDHRDPRQSIHLHVRVCNGAGDILCVHGDASDVLPVSRLGERFRDPSQGVHLHVWIAN